MPLVQVMYSSRPPSSSHLGRLRVLLPDHSVVAPVATDEAVAMASDTIAILGQRYLRQTLPFARGLKWVQASGAGFDHLPWSEIRERGAVLSVAGFAGPVVAQHAVMLGLALNRRLVDCAERQASASWGDDLYNLLPPRLRIALVLGLGSIGGRVAAMLSAGGIEVWGVSRSPSDAPKVDRLFTSSEWRDEASQADLLVVCLPGSIETRCFLDATTIRSLKRTATVVNVGRSETIDIQALAASLREGRLAGAAIDVMPGRVPLESTSALWDVPGLIITPYLAARYADRWQDLEAFVERQVERWVAGDPLEGVVTRDCG